MNRLGETSDFAANLIDLFNDELLALRKPQLSVAQLDLQAQGDVLDTQRYFTVGDPKRLVSASLVQFADCFGRGESSFCVCKLNTPAEARLWRQIFNYSESYFGYDEGSHVQVTLLADSVQSILQIEQIIDALNPYVCGIRHAITAYLIDAIKYNDKHQMISPDSSQLLSNKSPLARSYTHLLRRVCAVGRLDLSNDCYDTTLEYSPESKLLACEIPGGSIQERHVRNKLRHVLVYLMQFSHGQRPTEKESFQYELCLTQLKQWLKRRASMSNGARVDNRRVKLDLERVAAPLIASSIGNSDYKTLSLCLESIIEVRRDLFETLSTPRGDRVDAERNAKL